MVIGRVWGCLAIFQFEIDFPATTYHSRLMHVIDILTSSFCLSLLGIYGLILLVHHLLPRKVAPLLSTLLDETQELLGRAEEIGAVPLQSEYKKVRLDRYEDLRVLLVDSPNISYCDVVRHTSLQ